MLLRSLSTPILHSSRDSPSESESPIQLPRTRTFFSVSKSTRILSENDLKDLSISKRMPDSNFKDKKDSPMSVHSLNALFFSNSGLDNCGYTRNKGFLKVADDDGTGGRGSGGKSGGGGNSDWNDDDDDDDDDDDGGSSNWGPNHESIISDSYYEKIIAAIPGNPLLLTNYAIFLKEVHGDLNKAKEYCERAILEDPNDGSTLSYYADLIWEIQKNVNRADNYFNRAIKASPDDCNVMASYARFLWAVDDEVDRRYEKENADDEKDTCDANSSPNNQIQ